MYYCEIKQNPAIKAEKQCDEKLILPTMLGNNKRQDLFIL